MKILLKVIVIIAIFGITAVQAQKFGYINASELLLAMPERQVAEATIKDEAKKLEAQLAAMTGEYQSKAADYQANEATMSDLIKQTKAQEIGDLEQRIQAFRQSAQGTLQQKEQELLAPLVEKAKAAINKVAKDNKFTYIFDAGVGALLYQPEGDNIMLLVKKEMGIAIPPPTE